LRRIHVLGDLNLDLILSGMTELPVAGREILAREHRCKAGGSAANVAVVLALCGAPVRLYACVGRDAEGALALADLRRQGLRTSTVRRVDDCPTAVTVSLTYPQDRMYVTAPGTLGRTGLEGFKRGYLHTGAHLHLGSFFLQRQLRPSVASLLARAKRARMTTSLDPGHDPEGLWELGDLEAALSSLDWLLPNAAETCALAGTDRVEAALAVLGERFRKARGSPEGAVFGLPEGAVFGLPEGAVFGLPEGAVFGIVAKAGAEGAWLWQDGRVTHVPAVPTTVVDTTCAGDCFDAGFLYALCSGRSAAEAVATGNRLGALGASCLGLPSREAVREAGVAARRAP